jgi:hypothetical protein
VIAKAEKRRVFELEDARKASEVIRDEASIR